MSAVRRPFYEMAKVYAGIERTIAEAGPNGITASQAIRKTTGQHPAASEFSIVKTLARSGRIKNISGDSRHPLYVHTNPTSVLGVKAAPAPAPAADTLTDLNIEVSRPGTVSFSLRGIRITITVIDGCKEPANMR